jgi:hypothetical protein
MSVYILFCSEIELYNSCGCPSVQCHFFVLNVCALSSNLVQWQDPHPHEIAHHQHGLFEILYSYTMCSTNKLIVSVVHCFWKVEIGKGIHTLRVKIVCVWRYLGHGSSLLAAEWCMLPGTFLFLCLQFTLCCFATIFPMYNIFFN